MPVGAPPWLPNAPSPYGSAARAVALLHHQASVVLSKRLGPSDTHGNLRDIVLEEAFIHLVPAVWLIQHPQCTPRLVVLDPTGCLLRTDLVLLSAARDPESLSLVAWTVLSIDGGSRLERETWSDSWSGLLPRPEDFGSQAAGADPPTLAEARSAVVRKAARCFGAQAVSAILSDGLTPCVGAWFSSPSRPWHWAWSGCDGGALRLEPPKGWFPAGLMRALCVRESDARSVPADSALTDVLLAAGGGPRDVGLSGWSVAQTPCVHLDR